MSMLSSMTEKLRLTADKVESFWRRNSSWLRMDAPTITRAAVELRDAAETIDSLRCTCNDLQAENARLREFAARLVEYVDPASHQDTCNVECPAYARCCGKPTCAFPDWVLEKAKELGVEVDE